MAAGLFHRQVKDNKDESWEAGEVMAVDEVLGPRVRKDGYEGAYFWDNVRPVPTDEEREALDAEEKRLRRERRRERRAREIGTAQERAARRNESGDYPAAEEGLRSALAWNPEESQGQALPLDALIDAAGTALAPDLAAAVALASVEERPLALAAFAVYEEDGDAAELADTLARLVALRADDGDDVGDAESDPEPEFAAEGAAGEGSGDIDDDATTDSGGAPSLEEEGAGDDNDQGESEDGDEDEVEEGDQESFSLSINAQPSTLLFHQVVHLIKLHLDLADDLSAPAVADEAAGMLELELEGKSLRKRLNSILIELRSGDDEDGDDGGGDDDSA